MIQRLLYSFVLFVGFCGQAFSQSNSEIQIPENIHEPARKMPEFPGGERAMFCFFDSTLDKALLNSLDTSGRIVATFVIDSSGHVTDIEIIKSLVPAADEEFTRVLKLMPYWTPGEYNFGKQNMKMTIPLRVPYKNIACKDEDDKEE